MDDDSPSLEAAIFVCVPINNPRGDVQKSNLKQYRPVSYTARPSPQDQYQSNKRQKLS